MSDYHGIPFTEMNEFCIHSLHDGPGTSLVSLCLIITHYLHMHTLKDIVLYIIEWPAVPVRMTDDNYVYVCISYGYEDAKDHHAWVLSSLVPSPPPQVHL